MYSAPEGSQVVLSSTAQGELPLDAHEGQQLAFVLGCWGRPNGAVRERCRHCQAETGDVLALTGYPVLDTCPHCRRELAPF